MLQCTISTYYRHCKRLGDERPRAATCGPLCLRELMFQLKCVGRADDAPRRRAPILGGRAKPSVSTGERSPSGLAGTGPAKAADVLASAVRIRGRVFCRCHPTSGSDRTEEVPIRHRA
jgi:hypothetical protein